MPKRQAPRNRHAYHPIMRKGGVHEKSTGAKRAAGKRETRRKSSEWLACSSIVLHKFLYLLRILNSFTNRSLRKPFL